MDPDPARMDGVLLPLESLKVKLPPPPYEATERTMKFAPVVFIAAEIPPAGLGLAGPLTLPA